MTGVRQTLAVLWVIVVLVILIAGTLVYYLYMPLKDPAEDEREQKDDILNPNKIPSIPNQEPEPASDEEPGTEPTTPDTEPETEPEQSIEPSEPEPEPPEPPEEPPVDIDKQQQKSWTTLFYVAYDNSIGPMDIWESDRYFLEQIGSDEHINLVAFVDQEIEGDCHVLVINEGESIEYKPSIINPAWGDELNTGDPEVLREFLRWGVKKFPADYYDFHMMDHGGGWMGACIDEPADNSMIHAPDFAEITEDLSGVIRKRIDILSFDACFMASFEFSWEVAEHVHFLTGMQTIAAGDNDGDMVRGNFEVEAIWTGLKENPNWTPEEFAIHQVNSFMTVGPYLMPTLGHTHPYSSDTMSTCDLSEMVELKTAFSKLASELYVSVTGDSSAVSERTLIQEVIGPSVASPDQNTETFTGQSDYIGLGIYYFYDIGDFVSRLIEYGDQICNKETAREFLELYEKYVVSIVHGDDVKQGEHPDASGNDIYLPYRNGKFDVRYSDLSISQETYWDEFLQAVPWSQ